MVDTRVKEIQLTMMKKVIDVCKSNDLRVWVDGGTLLGAVRHHGYIPWDDDIDLFMPREDYMKLVDIGREEFKTPFFCKIHILIQAT